MIEVIIYALCGLLPAVDTSCFTCADAPAGTIFCDDFESTEDLRLRYFGYDNDEGEFIRMKGAGRNGSAGMRVKWQKGEVEAGVLQKAIGRSPAGSGMSRAAYPEKDFNEIYWRIDIKHQAGWQGGGGDKLTRATSIAGSNWQQGMIAHIWSGGKAPGNMYLVMDPASGISEDGRLRSERYNDFPHLRWLGSSTGNMDIFSAGKTGEWYCIVAHVKLNTPGKSDGVFEYWINDSLQAARYDLNWHGDWNSYMINGVFFENYWNKGSVQDQERYFDNILISTKPVSCGCGE